MSVTRKIQIELPEAMAQKVEAKVASGAFADESAVVTEALEDVFVQDEIVERWLRDAVLPEYDEWRRDGVPGLTIEQVRAALLRRRGPDAA